MVSIIIKGEGAEELISKLVRDYKALDPDACGCSCDEYWELYPIIAFNGNRIDPKCIEDHLSGIRIFDVGRDGGTLEILDYIASSLLNAVEL